MSRIEIVSASAGSGKTHRLASVLEEEVLSGRVRTDAILATTFTNKAAAELAERVRVRLLQCGRVEEAQRLSAARIGTVNSVCNRLVADYAFLLGCSPSPQVLDESAARDAFRRALASLAISDEARELTELSGRMVDLDWWRDVERVAQLARTNGIAAAGLATCAARSAQGFAALLGTPTIGSKAANAALERALRRFRDEVDVSVDKTKVTAGYLHGIAAALDAFARGHIPTWNAWAALANDQPGAKSRELAEAVQQAAAQQDRHAQLHQDCRRAIELVFGIAARALQAYAEHKRSAMAVDFVDQEVQALQLLGLPEVRQQLGEQLDLVLVDEFQDTSPLQLAIFLALAEIARRCVWVGDQKQAVFSFRGTDPALMDAAIAQILGTDEPETLGTSWRSRPTLVHVTSELFGVAFADHGIPAARVKLAAAAGSEPKGLGAAVERWYLDGKNIPARVEALAAGVKDLLSEAPSVRERGGGVRPLRPADVAVLCRKNDLCGAVANALDALGVKATVPRTGLLSTPEGLLCFAALRLWVAPGDRLAAAELARVLKYPGDGDAWAAELLERGAAAFDEVPAVRRIRDAREARPSLGPVAALDAALEAADVAEICLGWGDAAMRLSNVEALRAYAVAHARSGRSGTPAGLVTYLADLQAEERAGEQAALASQDAVVVSTYHKAKGLEWPVAVLLDVQELRRASPAGVHALSDGERVDLAQPLADRWIRYWPTPYAASRTKTPFHQRLDQSPEARAALQSDRYQELRLMYVGWTRARDRLVLAAPPGRLDRGLLSLVRGPDGGLLVEPQGEGVQEVTWAGVKLEVTVRNLAARPPVTVQRERGEGYVASGPRSHPPAFAQPSAIERVGHVVDVERIGDPIPLPQATAEANLLGHAVHDYMAAARNVADATERSATAAELLSRWRCGNALAADDLLRAEERFRAWQAEHWPDATARAEVPLHRRLAGGTELRGIVDLVLELPHGFVVVDHKLIHGDHQAAVEKCASFAGQLAAYAEAINAVTGKPCLGCFAHLPAQGVVVRLGLKEES